MIEGIQVQRMNHENGMEMMPGYLKCANLLGYWMNLAIQEAKKASSENEVPVGAVLVNEEGLVWRDHNRIISRKDPSAHAEMLCLREASQSLGTERPGGTMIVTLEPCSMCAGMMILSRIDALIFGAFDHKTGACGSVIQVARGKHANHKFPIFGGFQGDISSQLLKSFFRERRKKS